MKTSRNPFFHILLVLLAICCVIRVIWNLIIFHKKSACDRIGEQENAQKRVIDHWIKSQKILVDQESCKQQGPIGFLRENEKPSPRS